MKFPTLTAAVAAAIALTALAVLDPVPFGSFGGGHVSAQAKPKQPGAKKPISAWVASALCDAPPGLTAVATATDVEKRVAYIIGGMAPKSGEDAAGESEMYAEVRTLSLASTKPEWKTVETKGEAPTKRAWGAAAISQKLRTLYYFGGYGEKPGSEPGSQAELLNDFYALNLDTFTWKRMAQLDPRDYPGVRDVHVLAINEKTQTLWLSGGIGEASATAFTARDDLWSYSITDGLWKQHKPAITLMEVKTKPTNGIPDARFGHAMIVDGDGRLMIAGGQSARLRTQLTTWIYDPTTDRLTQGPSLPDGRSGSTGLWHEAQKVMLLVAGQSEGGEHDDVVAWKWGDENWHHCGRTGAPGYYGGAWLDDRNKSAPAIIALPGQRDPSRPKNPSTTLRLTAKGNASLATLANMMFPDGLPVGTDLGKGPGNRYALNSVFDPVDQRVIAWGGQENIYRDGVMADGKWHGDFQVLDVRAKVASEWRTLEPTEGSPKPKERSYAAMAIAPKSRKIWLHGGFGPPDEGGQGAVFRDDLWVFNLATRQWQQIVKPDGAAWPGVRDAHPLIVSDDEKSLYTFGGLKQFAAAGLVCYNDLWRFDVDSQIWSELSDPVVEKRPATRFFSGFVNVGGGKAMLFGGFQGNGRGIHSDLWELDLATGVFTQKPSPVGEAGQGARSAFGYAWDAKNRRILMAGGSRASVTDDIFALDLSKGQWQAVGHTGTRSAYGTAVCDPASGALYYFGGTVGSFFDEHCADRVTRWTPEPLKPDVSKATTK